MTSTDYVRYSEQTASIMPLFIAEKDGADDGREPSARTERSSASKIVRQVMLRDQVQADLSKLIRDYEEASGLVVIRVLYEKETHRVNIEAIPAK